MSTNARLASTELTHTDLSGLDFRGCNLQLCSFADADMHGALWDGARGEMFDELEALRTAKETFDEVDAERARQESRADDAEVQLNKCTEERDNARLEASDRAAQIVDLQATLDRVNEENAARLAVLEASLRALRGTVTP
jgi:uncharacterized protein YjbI with pentapeptide repeats